MTAPYSFIPFTAYDKVGDEIEPDLNDEATEMTIIHMTAKHNHNRIAFLEANKRDYFKYKDAERFEIEIEGRNDKNLQNEQNPEKDPEPDNSDIIFVPEVLSALQEAIKVNEINLFTL